MVTQLITGNVIRVIEACSTEQDRLEIVSWFALVREVISNDSLSVTEKIKNIYELIDSKKTMTIIFRSLQEVFETYKDSDLPWSIKIALPITVAAATIVGGQGAGLAAFGGAIGIPVLLIVFLGAAGITTVIEAFLGESEARNYITVVSAMIARDEILRRTSKAMREAMANKPVEPHRFEMSDEEEKIKNKLLGMDPFDFERHVILIAKFLRRAMAKGNGGWKKSLAAVLKAHGRYSADGHKGVSYATTDKRSDVLFSGFRELRALGYKLNDVKGFRETHLKALVSQWEQNGQSPATLQNKISVFRTFSEWLGKRGMVRASEQYVTDPAHARRSSIAQEDRSWSAKGVDIAAKLEAVKAVDARVGLQLELQAPFGLRAKEAMLLKPHWADKGTYLAVCHGTKGGRERVVPIDTPAKRELLDRAKTFAASKLASTADPTKTLAQVCTHYYQVVRRCGISRADGITSHGLRHEYANTKYQALDRAGRAGAWWRNRRGQSGGGQICSPGHCRRLGSLSRVDHHPLPGPLKSLCLAWLPPCWYQSLASR